ncbi:MAG: ATP synthase F1 subunit epsilon [Planctomycetaceae bacterium]|nr:ATP synthase F1 subunit epsilon [Planctomycetaceae bacterium]
MAKLQSIVVTPEATVRDEPADFVVLPLYDGELGIAPGHTPLIGRLGFGEMRIVRDGVTTRIYLDGGFAQVADNVVSVMTSRAIPAENLDSAVAEQQLAAARGRRADTPETMALRDRAEQQARAQLRVARHAGR